MAFCTQVLVVITAIHPRAGLAYVAIYTHLCVYNGRDKLSLYVCIHTLTYCIDSGMIFAAEFKAVCQNNFLT